MVPRMPRILAKFCGLMLEGKYSAVIGYMKSTPGNSDWVHAKTRIFQPITAPCFTWAFSFSSPSAHPKNL